MRASQARVFQLAPSVVRQVAAIFATLERCSWYQFAVITTNLGGHEDFVRAVRDRQLKSKSVVGREADIFAYRQPSFRESTSGFPVQPQTTRRYSVLEIRTIRGLTRQEFRCQLEPIAAGEARVILLFASKDDSRELFAAALQLEMTGNNYVWIVTQSVIGAHPGIAPPEYPAGLLGRTLDTKMHRYQGRRLARRRSGFTKRSPAEI
nr:glutamate receptor ionotropic, NMDA 2A-like [Dermacentor andersoni]